MAVMKHIGSKIGRLSLTLQQYDAEIQKHRLAIIELQRERIKASLEAARAIRQEGEKRSKAIREARESA